MFQAYLYAVLGDKEHEGFQHPKSGKVFKRTNFRIRYIENRIEIDFTSLDETHEFDLATAILKEGLKLGEIAIAKTEVSILKRQAVPPKMRVRGFVCASLKNRLTRKKIFLQPGDERHSDIITRNAKEKFETLLGKPYTGVLRITPQWQDPRSMSFRYEQSTYIAWQATYEIEADEEMLHLLLTTGMGSDTMKGLGFLEVSGG
jgi:CRISPR-associated endoribonuclease Cas6